MLGKQECRYESFASFVLVCVLSMVTTVGSDPGEQVLDKIKPSQAYRSSARRGY